MIEKFSSFEKNYKLTDLRNSRNSRQKKHKENYIKAHQNHITQKWW